MSTEMSTQIAPGPAHGTEITWLGHATVMIRRNGRTIMTDPVFSNRVLLVKRRKPFPLALNQVPNPDAVFISHAHYDHLDLHTLKYFDCKTVIVTPRGLGRLISKFVKNPIVEISTGSQAEIFPGLKTTTFAVNHSSFRLSGLTYRGCHGYWIDWDGTKIFFPGDTGYRDFSRFQGADVALLPIGPCEPKWFMKPRHLDPEDALRVFQEINAQRMIPIHWGTFKLGLDPADQPMHTLKGLLSQKNLHDRVPILAPGQVLKI